MYLAGFPRSGKSQVKRNSRSRNSQVKRNSRSGKSQGILSLVSEILIFGKSQGFVESGVVIFLNVDKYS